MVGVVFTGLEHSLHILASVAVVFGVARVVRGLAVPPWLVPAIVLLPFLRMEGVAMAGLAVMALILSRRRGAALAASAALLGLTGGYAVAMSAMGLPLVPSSVLVKLGGDASVAAHSQGALQFLHAAILNAFHGYRCLSILVPLGLVLLHPLLRALNASAVRGDSHRFTLRQELVLAAVVSGTLTAHALLGAWDDFSRYEIYAVATGATGVIILWHDRIAGFLANRSAVIIALAGTALLLANPWYLLATLRTPSAGRGIFEQQYQMRRFAVDFYRKPVAVNDIGLVSYRNSNYVLDLWGLGSEPARKARLLTPKSDWMDRLAQAHDVGVAMIYPAWFKDEIPEGWHRIAVLEGRHSRVTTGAEQVTFYATSSGAEPQARAAVRRFAAAIGPDSDIAIVGTASDPRLMQGSATPEMPPPS